MSYLLNGTIRSAKMFRKKGARLNDTADQRQQVVYAVNQSLNLIITSPMPLLEVKWASWPKVLFAGEVRKVVLTLTNRGQRSLVALKVRLNHPAFFFFGNREELDSDLYQQGAVEGDPAISKTEQPNQMWDPAIVALQLPDHEGVQSLKPGETLQLPVWIRGDRLGPFNFPFLFAYQAETSNPVMKLRFLRWEQALTVSPSVRFSAVTRPSAKGVNQYLIGIEMENQTTNGVFYLKQVSAASPSWKVEALSFPASASSVAAKTPAAEVRPKETCCFYFRLSRLSSFTFDLPTSPEAVTSAALTEYIKDNPVTAVISPSVISFTDLPCTVSDSSHFRFRQKQRQTPTIQSKN